MDKSEYLNISKASDIKDIGERRLYRFFEMIPGIISLGTLLGVFIFSWLFPSWVAIFIICFCFYYLFRVFYFSLHQIIGYFRVKVNMRKNWLKELRKFGAPHGSWKNIFHIVILPAYKESKKIISESIEAILKSEYPKEKIIVVLSIEEKAGQFYQEQAKELAKAFSHSFFKFLIVIHPSGIQGEISGKGSNTAYAGKVVKEKIIDKLGISYQDTIVSTFCINIKSGNYGVLIGNA